MAVGLVLSVVTTVPADTGVPSPQLTVRPRVSSQPGSVTVAVIVTGEFSCGEGVASTTVVGATFVTLTVAVSMSEAPWESVSSAAAR